MSMHYVLGTRGYTSADIVLSVGEYMGVDLAIGYATSENHLSVCALIK